jgi:hypothetical protein
MSEICIGYNNTNDKLPVYRMEFIALRITMFIRLFQIKNSDWPLDCTKLIRKMKKFRPYPLLMASSDYPTNMRLELYLYNESKVIKIMECLLSS